MLFHRFLFFFSFVSLSCVAVCVALVHEITLKDNIDNNLYFCARQGTGSACYLGPRALVNSSSFFSWLLAAGFEIL